MPTSTTECQAFFAGKLALRPRDALRSSAPCLPAICLSLVWGLYGHLLPAPAPPFSSCSKLLITPFALFFASFVFPRRPYRTTSRRVVLRPCHSFSWRLDARQHSNLPSPTVDFAPCVTVQSTVESENSRDPTPSWLLPTRRSRPSRPRPRPPFPLPSSSTTQAARFAITKTPQRTTAMSTTTCARSLPPTRRASGQAVPMKTRPHAGGVAGVRPAPSSSVLSS